MRLPVKFQLLYGPTILVVLWYGVWFARIINPLFLPAPHQVFGMLGKMAVQIVVWQDAVSTLGRITISVLISAIIGIPVGLLIGYYGWAYKSSELMLDFFRSLPALALFPLFLLVFGIGDSAKVATAVFASTLVIVLNTRYGVTQSLQIRRIVAKIIGATKIEVFLRVVFFDALPQIFVGLRTAISLAVIVIVVTEMFVGTSFGLGHRIYESQLMYRVPEMYATIIITGLLGYALNKAIVIIENRVVHWSGR